MNHYENIPEELKSLNQWVCANDDSKTPMRAFEYAAASSTDSFTWSDYDTALEAVTKGYYDYCGFVFNDNGIVGIDIDCGFDEFGLMTPLATDIIGHCKSYTEKSKSGRGFHILLKGTLPFKGKNNLAGVEIYRSSRYFIVTGDTLLYQDITENQEAVDYVVETYFANVRDEKSDRNGDRIYRPIWPAPKDGRIKVRPVYPEITSGSRNLCLASLAGSLHNMGYSRENILAELLYCNSTACNPPLDKSEIQTICNSITKYKR